MVLFNGDRGEVKVKAGMGRGDPLSVEVEVLLVFSSRSPGLRKHAW